MVSLQRQPVICLYNFTAIRSLSDSLSKRFQVSTTVTTTFMFFITPAVTIYTRLWQPAKNAHKYTLIQSTHWYFCTRANFQKSISFCKWSLDNFLLHDSVHFCLCFSLNIYKSHWPATEKTKDAWAKERNIEHNILIKQIFHPQSFS